MVLLISEEMKVVGSSSSEGSQEGAFYYIWYWYTMMCFYIFWTLNSFYWYEALGGEHNV